jgi:putative flippase GtrA
MNETATSRVPQRSTDVLSGGMIRKAATFALVGTVNMVVDFSLFSLAYFVLGLSIVAANVLAWSIAVTGSYVMNSTFTFAEESGRRLRLKAYATFVVAQLGGLLASTVTVFVASYFMPVLVGKLLAIGVTFLINFSLSHFIVFRRQAEPNDVR